MARDMRQAHVALIEAIQASWSNPDPESFVSLFTKDGIFEDKAYGIALIGHEQLRAHALRMKKHIVGLSIDILTCDATDSTGVAEWRLRHVFEGNFDGVDCTGKPILIEGLSLYQFSDGHIQRAADYWNYMEIVRSVGVLPKELRNFRTS
jgi:steroid delta-isomerase-like uncharacterized protein